jgi:hypothetical protein
MCCRLIQDTDLSEHLRTALMMPADQKTGERLHRTVAVRVAVQHSTVPSRENQSRMLVQAESIRTTATRAANAVEVAGCNLSQLSHGLTGRHRTMASVARQLALGPVRRMNVR